MTRPLVQWLFVAAAGAALVAFALTHDTGALVAGAIVAMVGCAITDAGRAS